MMRRVVINSGAALEADDNDRMQDGEAIVVDPDAWDAAENERRAAAELEGEGLRAAQDRAKRDFWGYERGHEEDSEPLRDRDLTSVGVDERRNREASGHHRSNPTAPRYADDAEVWAGDDAEHHAGALRLRRSLEIKEDWETETSMAQSNAWIKANDPKFSESGVRDDLAAAFEASGLALEDVRGRAFPKGRPNAAARDLRTAVRTALLPIYEDGRSRELMSQALGCSTSALHRLMGVGIS